MKSVALLYTSATIVMFTLCIPVTMSHGDPDASATDESLFGCKFAMMTYVHDNNSNIPHKSSC